jgi:Uma2 family endonuclease
MVLDNATLRLDNDNEPQPDAMVRLEPALGGRSWVTADDYLAGSPELIVEIAASSAAHDLNSKLHAYQRNGVQEYLVFQMYEQQAVWFALREGVYQPFTPDETGILRSAVFPGLWLQPAALFSGNLAGLFAVLQAGLASPEHAEFVARLRDKAK